MKSTEMIHLGGNAYAHPNLGDLPLEQIDSLIPHPENPKNGDTDEIGLSIEMTGLYRPVYVQTSTRYILAGNHTTAATAELGGEKIPVVWLDVDEATALRILLGDNKLAEIGRIDQAQLLVTLERLQQIDSRVIGTGYSERDIENLRTLAQMPMDLTTEADHATWPMLVFHVPPHMKNGFYSMTEEAIGDKERFELLLRLAGWDGAES